MCECQAIVVWLMWAQCDRKAAGGSPQGSPGDGDCSIFIHFLTWTGWTGLGMSWPWRMMNWSDVNCYWPSLYGIDWYWVCVSQCFITCHAVLHYDFRHGAIQVTALHQILKLLEVHHVRKPNALRCKTVALCCLEAMPRSPLRFFYPDKTYQRNSPKLFDNWTYDCMSWCRSLLIWYDMSISVNSKHVFNVQV